MKTSIIRIGNSQGLRIPKPILKQCNLSGEVELEVRGNELVIKPIARSRKNWEKAFKTMAANKDDRLPAFPDSHWDREEWEWK